MARLSERELDVLHALYAEQQQQNGDYGFKTDYNAMSAAFAQRYADMWREPPPRPRSARALRLAWSDYKLVCSSDQLGTGVAMTGAQKRKREEPERYNGKVQRSTKSAAKLQRVSQRHRRRRGHDARSSHVETRLGQNALTDPLAVDQNDMSGLLYDDIDEADADPPLHTSSCSWSSDDLSESFGDLSKKPVEFHLPTVEALIIRPQFLDYLVVDVAARSLASTPTVTPPPPQDDDYAEQRAEVLYQILTDGGDATAIAQHGALLREEDAVHVRFACS